MQVFWKFLFLSTLILGTSSCNAPRKNLKQITMINPPNVYATYDRGFSQGVRAHVSEIIFLSGIVGWQENRKLKDQDDFTSQTQQAFRNIMSILAHENLSENSILHLRYFVVNLSPERVQRVAQAMAAIFKFDYKPATTIVGVSALARPDLLIEIEVTAVAK